MAVLQPYKDDYYLWHYLPSVPAAVIFLLLFLGCSFGLIWRSWKAHVKFGIPFIIGTFFEVVGYGARASAYQDTSSVFRYALQNVFTLLGPTLMAATIYMIFGRLASALHAEKHSIVRVSVLTKLFVGGDVFAFIMQGGSAGLLMIEDLATIGKTMVIVGLIIQIVSFGLFMVTSAVFHKRLVNDLTRKAFSSNIPWIRIMRLMYAISLMIMVRSIFRLVEYTQGMDGYCMHHEWTLYVFDSIPMALSAIVMVVWFPTMLRETIR